MNARWLCKPCRHWGYGGPDAYLRHAQAKHVEGGGAASEVAFGFSRQNPGRTVWASRRERP